MESNTFFPIFTAPPISDPRLCGAAQRSARRPQLFRMGALDGAFGMFEDKPYTGLWAAASCGDPRRARLRFKAGGDDLAHIDALARRFSPIEIQEKHQPGLTTDITIYAVNPKMGSQAMMKSRNLPSDFSHIFLFSPSAQHLRKDIFVIKKNIPLFTPWFDVDMCKGICDQVKCAAAGVAL